MRRTRRLRSVVSVVRSIKAGRLSAGWQLDGCFSTTSQGCGPAAWTGWPPQATGFGRATSHPAPRITSAATVPDASPRTPRIGGDGPSGRVQRGRWPAGTCRAAQHPAKAAEPITMVATAV